MILQTAIHKAIPHARKVIPLARRAFNAMIDGYHAIHAEFRNCEIKRLCTACKKTDFEHSLDPDNFGGRSKSLTDFIWHIDHVIIQRDSCTFCRLIFDALSIKPIGLLEPLVSASMVPKDWEARELPQGHRSRIEAALQTCKPGNLGQALCFEGVTASFNLEPATSRTFRFQVKEGPVTEVIQDWHRVTRLNNSSSAGRVKIDYKACQSSQCEFFILSEAQFFGSENRIEGLGYGIYNVLAFKRVCKNGKVGVIEKIGIGKIKKQEWHLAKPKREIFLPQ